jgi:hypothetical protein
MGKTAETVINSSVHHATSTLYENNTNQFQNTRIKLTYYNVIL